MTRTSRMILTMILAVVLSVVFTVPSFANEASEASDKETVIIRDADAGTVTPEVIAEHTPEMTWEFTHPEEPKAPAATQKKAEETPKPKVSEPAPKETKAPVAEAPATEAPVTEASEETTTEAEATETFTGILIDEDWHEIQGLNYSSSYRPALCRKSLLYRLFPRYRPLAYVFASGLC